MASIIRIKRSGSAGNPSTLGAGELAYSALTDNGSNGGDRLYIGFGTETDGDAANHYVIGGKFFTDRLDHTAGTLTASSAIVVDGNKKIDDLLVDNIQINGNTISSTDANGSLYLTPNGTGDLVLDGQNWPQADGSADQFLKTDGAGQLSWAAVPSGSFDLAADSGSNDTFTTGQTLTFTGGTGLSSTVADNEITFAIDNTVATLSGTQTLTNKTIDAASNTVSNIDTTMLASGVLDTDLDAVSASDDTLASAKAIKAYVDQEVGGVTTSLTLAADTGTSDTFNTGETLTLSGGTGIDTSVTDNEITIAIDSTVATKTGTETLTNKTIDLTDNSLSGTLSEFNTALSDGTFAEIAATQTLTNKTIDSASNTLTVDLSEATVTGTLAEFNTAVSDATLVSTSGTETLTNKTISGSSNTLSNIANASLTNSSVTIGSTSVSLGATATDIAGVTSLDVDNITIDGNEISSTNSNGNISLNPNGTGTVAVNSARITGLADPTNSDDAATKGYVDARAAGLDVKESVRVASTGNVDISTELTNGDTLDGVTLATGDRVLLKDQSTASQNGVYVVVASGAASRATDFDEPAEVTAGVFFFIEEGTANADAGFVITSDNPQTVGTDPLTFTQFSGAGQITAGDGLAKSGNTLSVNVANGIEISGDNVQLASSTAGGGLGFSSGELSVNTANGIEVSSDNVQLASSVAGDGLTYNSGVVNVVGTADKITVSADAVTIASTYLGQNSITTLGTITTGTWTGTAIGAAYGGTGQTSYTAGDLLVASGSTALSKLTLGASGKVLQSNGSTLVYGDVDGGTYS